MPPIIIAAGIAAAAAIGGAAISAHAAGSAADKQVKASQAAGAQFSPFQQAGAAVLPGLVSGVTGTSNYGGSNVGGGQASTITGITPINSGGFSGIFGQLAQKLLERGTPEDLAKLQEMESKGLITLQHSQPSSDQSATGPGGLYGRIPQYANSGAQSVTSPGSLIAPFTDQFKPPTVTDDPGYQFRLQQGQQALERSAAAKGGLTTGGTIKATEQYAQGLASQEYGNAFARALTQYGLGRENFYQNQANAYNRQMGVAELGVQGAQGTANALTQGGAAAASGAVGAGNAWSGAVGNIGNTAENYLLLSQLYGQHNDVPMQFAG